MSLLGKILSVFSRKPRHIIKGMEGEELAKKHLKAKGFMILERNFRVRGGEADIIASTGERIVVVEIKTRTTGRFGPPQAAVDRRKFRRLVLAGTVYCRMKNIPVSSLRIDVIAIQMKGKETTIRHFENIGQP